MPRDNKLERADAVSLLKEILSNCESFRFAQVVSISKNKEAQGWNLSAKWSRPESEKDSLNNIMLKHGVEASEVNGYTVFR